MAEEIFYLRESHNCPRTFDTNFSTVALFHILISRVAAFEIPLLPARNNEIQCQGIKKGSGQEMGICEMDFFSKNRGSSLVQSQKSL